MSFVVGAIGLVLTGCASVPKVRISNVERETIAKTLWEQGHSRTTITLDHVSAESVWPSFGEINKPRTVIKYTLTNHFIYRKRCRDTLSIVSESPNDTVVSLKCKEKNYIFDYLHYLWPFYKRNTYREQTVMLNTVRALQDNEGFNMEWLSKWKPDM
jgi:hypothetical protein